MCYTFIECIGDKLFYSFYYLSLMSFYHEQFEIGQTRDRGMAKKNFPCAFVFSQTFFFMVEGMA